MAISSPLYRESNVYHSCRRNRWRVYSGNITYISRKGMGDGVSRPVYTLMKSIILLCFIQLQSGPRILYNTSLAWKDIDWLTSTTSLRNEQFWFVLQGLSWIKFFKYVRYVDLSTVTTLNSNISWNFIKGCTKDKDNSSYNCNYASCVYFVIVATKFLLY